VLVSLELPGILTYRKHDGIVDKRGHSLLGVLIRGEEIRLS